MGRHGLRLCFYGLLLSALAVGSAGCAGKQPEDGPREAARNVRVMPVQTSAVTEFLELAGPLAPVRGTDIGSEEAGTVAVIAHDKGARVAAGAAVVTLDRRLLAAELQAAEAALALQEHNHAQVERLFAAGKVSRLEQLQSAAQLAESRSRAEVAQTRHDRASVKAPFAGLVTARHVEPGQLVLPGQTVARVVDPYMLKLNGTLTDAEVAWVHEGMPAAIAVAGVPGTVPGVVAWVGFEAELQTGKFPLEIHVANRDLAYRAGVIGRARLTKRTTDHLVVIPRDAILPGDRIHQVFVVEGDRAHKRQIVLGPDQGLQVAVKEGLTPGDLLVVRGQRALRDGGLVHITERVAFGDGTGEADPDLIRATSAGPRVVGEVAR
jgi:membrane fusion protein (multidrug efflux system)